MYVLLTVASDDTLTSIVYFLREGPKKGYLYSNRDIPLLSPFNIRREYLNLFKIDSF